MALPLRLASCCREPWCRDVEIPVSHLAPVVQVLVAVLPMSSKSKAKGTRFEREVADMLAEYWPAADRRVLHGNRDQGDIANVPFWTLELKAEKAMRLAEYMAEAEKEAENAKTPYFAAIVKRPRKGVEEAYVVFPLWLWMSLAPVLEIALRDLQQQSQPATTAPIPPGDAARDGDTATRIR